MHFINEFIDFLLNKLVFDLDLKESLFVGFNRTDNVVIEEVLSNFFSELDNSFTAEGSAFFLAFIHVEILHGIRGDIFKLIFRSVLDGNFGLGSRKCLLDDFPKFVFD